MENLNLAIQPANKAQMRSLQPPTLILYMGKAGLL